MLRKAMVLAAAATQGSDPAARIYELKVFA
jgi:hypothetical protein